MTETKRTAAAIRLYYGRLEKILAEAEAARDVKALHAALAVLGSFARTDLPRVLEAARALREAYAQAWPLAVADKKSALLDETAWLAEGGEATVE